MRKLFLSLLFTAILLWVGGFAYFTYASLHMNPEQPQTKTDAIIVLTGGPKRVEDGLALFAQGLSSQIFITGVHPSVSMDDIKHQAQGAALPECCITLGHEARTTIQNAIETKAWIEANDVASIRLVTADYHIPRAKIEFRAIMPGLEIIAHPVHGHGLTPEQEYFWIVMLSEYHKTIVRQLSVWLGLPAYEWVRP